MMGSLFTASAVREKAKIRMAQSAGEAASRTDTNARARAEILQFDLERLFMITEALWTLLKEEHGYTDDELMRRVENIDLRDGKLDGKVAKQANPLCPQCGRVLIGKRPMCLYCGTPVARAPFER